MNEKRKPEVDDECPPICPACGVTMGIVVDEDGATRNVCLECGFSDEKTLVWAGGWRLTARRSCCSDPHGGAAASGVPRVSPYRRRLHGASSAAKRAHKASLRAAQTA